MCMLLVAAVIVVMTTGVMLLYDVLMLSAPPVPHPQYVGHDTVAGTAAHKRLQSLRLQTKRTWDVAAQHSTAQHSTARHSTAEDMEQRERGSGRNFENQEYRLRHMQGCSRHSHQPTT